MRRLFGVLLAAIGGMLLVTAFVSPVSGRDLTVGTTVIYAEPGSHIELGRASVGEGIDGQVCTWQATATAGNQHSVHPGNVILVTSGPTTITLDGVEDVAGGSTTGTATGTLGTEIVVTLVMGPDGVFSGGVTVAVTFLGCETPTTVPTTTEPTTTESTTEPPASVEPSLPTTAAPTTALPTTALPATTVNVVVAPSSTLPALTELPVTGAATTAALAASGLGLVLAGVFLVRLSDQATALEQR